MEIEPMEAELVSVIIPTYNRAYCIARAIDSVLSQTYKQVEIIVVDDGSTDTTAELIKRCYAADARVRYLYQGNGGVSKARNTGLRAASGRFISFLDSDDAWKPWKVELQIHCMALLPQAGMIWTDMVAVDSLGVVLSERYLREMYSAYKLYTVDSLFPGPRLTVNLPGSPAVAGARLYSGDIYSPMVMGNLVHTSTVLMRSERRHAVGEFNENLHFSGEDYEFHLRTCGAGPVAFIDVASIEYRVGDEDQLTHERHRIDNARNVLNTITTVIRRDRARIDLPSAMLAMRQASLHERFGRAALESGNRRDARHHLFASLRIRPLRASALIYLVLASVPAAVHRVARALYHALRRVRRASDSRHAARAHCGVSVKNAPGEKS